MVVSFASRAPLSPPPAFFRPSHCSACLIPPAALDLDPYVLSLEMRRYGQMFAK